MVRPVAVLVLLAAAACAGGDATAPPPKAASTDAAGRALHAIFDAEWERTMRDRPTYASELGDRRYNGLWEDLRTEAIEARRAHRAELARTIARIDRGALSPDDWLNLDVFKRETDTDVDLDRFHLDLLPLNQREGLQTKDELADALRFETVKDYEDWLQRLRAFGAYADQTTALLAEGMRRGIVWPKVVMARVPAQIDKQLAADPGASPFYAPFKTFARGVPEADRARLTREARAAIAEVVVPAFRRFKEFFTAKYLPACQATIGLAALPDGAAMYEALVRHHTTTNLSPKEIHTIGQREVLRITSEMEGVMRKTGFTGTLREFFAFLRTDPRFYYATPEELFRAYAATAKRIDPELVKLFGTLPRTPYGVAAIPANVAPDTTTAYYREPAADGSRAGTYFVNLYKPEARPKWEMMALTLHESVPGHHLQIALATELTGLPAFRRHGDTTAFIEGWGLYAESLGDELGLYDDPYAKFGQLTYEMWRAVRLVVDTGMHATGWDRQRAIDFFLEHAPKQELDVVNEIDRYLVMPGQALAYKIGELKLKELRARAEKALGPRFDRRAFHDEVLGQGALPLDVLEARIDAWILAMKAKPAG